MVAPLCAVRTCVPRFLRQGSAAWRSAHGGGVLSSGLLPEALGLREVGAAKALGAASKWKVSAARALCPAPYMVINLVLHGA